MLPFVLFTMFLIKTKIIERAVMERFNIGASIVMKAILTTTESAQLKLSEPRTRKFRCCLAAYIVDQ
jgi:hypothetical protein